MCEWCWKQPYLFFPDRPSITNSTVLSRTSGIEPDERKTVSGGTFEISLRPESRILVTESLMKVSDLKLDLANPRFKHFGMLETEKEIEAALWKEPSTRTLFNSIKYAEGLTEPLLVDVHNVVREGNRRLVCLRRLNSKIRQGELDVPLRKVREVPCLVLPADVSEADLALYLTRIHVTGKKEWRTVNQAAYVYDLNHVHNLSFDEISELLERPPSALKKIEKAYQGTLQYHVAFPEDLAWMGKYSYFYEAYRHRKIAEWMGSKGNIAKFIRWIHSGKIAKGTDVRKLEVGATPRANGNRKGVPRKNNSDLQEIEQQSIQMLDGLKKMRKSRKLSKKMLSIMKNLQTEITKFTDDS